MTINRIVEVIENCMTKESEIDIDCLDGPYAVRGTLSENETIERLEVGRVVGEKYIPLVQMGLYPIPKIEKRNSSCLDYEGFSGTVCKLPEEGYTRIKTLLERLV